MSCKVIPMREYSNVRIRLIDNIVSDSKQSCEDVAVEVAENIILKGGIEREDIGVLVYVTQSPKFMTPSTSFYIHKQLNLGCDCFQYDINQGATGFLLGIQLLISLVQGFETKKKGLLLFGDNDTHYGSRAAGVLMEYANTDSKIIIDNCSYGQEYKKYICYNGETSLDESFVSLGKQYLCDEIQKISDYARQKNIRIDEVINCENQYQSATDVLKKLCGNKPNGNVIIGTFGAGISIATGILYFSKDMYI